MTNLIIKVIDEQLGLTESLSSRVSSYLDRKLKSSQLKFSNGLVKQRIERASSCFNYLAYINLVKVVKVQKQSRSQDEESSDDVGYQENVTSIRLRNLFEFFGKNEQINNIREFFFNPILCIYYLFVNYVLIKCILITIVHYMRDLKLNNYRPIYYQVANESTTKQWNKLISLDERKECSLRLATIYMTSRERKEIEQTFEYTRLLTLIGDATTIIQGSSIVSYATLASVVIIYFQMAIYIIHKNNYRLSVVNYLQNPVDESQRIYRESINTIKHLMDASLIIVSNEVCSYRTTNSDKPDSIEDTEKPFWSEIIIHLNENSCSLQNKCNLAAKLKDVRECKLAIENILDFDLLKLNILDQSNHLILSKVYLGFSMITFCVSFAGGCVFSSFNIFLSIYLKTLQRIAHLRCHNLAEFGRDFVEMEPTSLSDERKFLNLATDQEIPLELYLIEAKYYLYSNGYHWFEMFLLLFMLSSSICFYSGIHLIIHYERIIWLNEISDQIRTCIKLLYNYQQLESLSMSKNIFDGRHLKANRLSLTQSITIAYINYDLFRKQQKSFKSVSNFLSAQGAGLGLSTMLFAYVVGTTTKADSAFIMLATASFAACYLNYYVLITAIVTKKIDSLHIDIIRLLAFGQVCSLRQLHIFALWRRHLAGRAEARKLFAPSILSVHLTYDRLLTLNIYVLILWVVLMTKHRN